MTLFRAVEHGHCQGHIASFPLSQSSRHVHRNRIREEWLRFANYRHLSILRAVCVSDAFSVIIRFRRISTALAGASASVRPAAFAAVLNCSRAFAFMLEAFSLVLESAAAYQMELALRRIRHIAITAVIERIAVVLRASSSLPVLVMREHRRFTPKYYRNEWRRDGVARSFVELTPLAPLPVCRMVYRDERGKVSTRSLVGCRGIFLVA